MVLLLARLEGLEPPTYWFVASHSIQLSYKRITLNSFIIIRPIRRVVKTFSQSFDNNLLLMFPNGNIIAVVALLYAVR